MTTTNRKTSRSIIQNHTRTLGTLKQPQEQSNINNNNYNDKFAIEGLAKKIVLSNSPNYITENVPTKKQSVVNRVITPPEMSNNLDHSDCSKSINDLKQQIQNLKKENSSLTSELRQVSSDLTNSKTHNDKLTNDNLTLQSLYEELNNGNEILKRNYQLLSDEFVLSRNEWISEREKLEKSLNEIRKELENKIIEIRSKHSAEILIFEEKNRLLKNHLADTLKMRSVERQYELDRISNDLEKSQINEEHLRSRLNKIIGDNNSNIKTDNLSLCKNCNQLLKSDKNEEQRMENRKTNKKFNEIFNETKVEDRSKNGIVKSADNRK